MYYKHTIFIIHICFHPNQLVLLDSIDSWEMFRLRDKLWLIIMLFYSFTWFWICFFGFSLLNSIANNLSHKLLPKYLLFMYVSVHFSCKMMHSRDV